MYISIDIVLLTSVFIAGLRSLRFFGLSPFARARAMHSWGCCLHCGMQTRGESRKNRRSILHLAPSFLFVCPFFSSFILRIPLRGTMDSRAYITGGFCDSRNGALKNLRTSSVHLWTATIWFTLIRIYVYHIKQPGLSTAARHIVKAYVLTFSEI